MCFTIQNQFGDSTDPFILHNLLSWKSHRAGSSFTIGSRSLARCAGDSSFFHLFLWAKHISYQPQCRKKVSLHCYNNSTVFDRCLFTSQLNGTGTVPWHWSHLARKNWLPYYRAVFLEGGLIQAACWDQSLAHANSCTISSNGLERILAGTGQR